MGDVRPIPTVVTVAGLLDRLDAYTGHRPRCPVAQWDAARCDCGLAELELDVDDVLKTLGVRSRKAS